MREILVTHRQSRQLEIFSNDLFLQTAYVISIHVDIVHQAILSLLMPRRLPLPVHSETVVDALRKVLCLRLFKIFLHDFTLNLVASDGFVAFSLRIRFRFVRTDDFVQKIASKFILRDANLREKSEKNEHGSVVVALDAFLHRLHDLFLISEHSHIFEHVQRRFRFPLL